MIFSRKPSTDAQWELIRTVLQQLRGQGLWRGDAVQFRNKNLLRLPLEAIDKQTSYQACHIHISPELNDIWAEILPGGKRYHLKAYELDMEKFLRALLLEIRQRTYIRSNKDRADYRKN